jgi:orotate phosphoribosyltransferase
MLEQDILNILEETSAIRHGHFELSSGLHSDTYIQCASILQFPNHAEALGQALADKFRDLQVAVVASPAIGGILIGQEVGRALETRAIFAERDASGCLTLRRNFRLEPGERVVVIEDVWTTGGSTRETMAVMEGAGGIVVAAGAIIDRSGGELELPVRTEALLRLKVRSYDPEDCPQCRAGDAAVRPGSHFVRS